MVRVLFPVALALALVQALLPATPTMNSLLPGRNTPGARIVTAGGALSGVVFAAASQPPVIASLIPASATAGGGSFTLTINGKNFASTSTARWGVTPLKTIYGSATQLTAAVPASLIAIAGTASVKVSTAAGASRGAAFTITLPLPAITSLSPASAVAGRAFTMTINGRNFVPLATAKWGSTPLTTTYVNGMQLKAAVPAGMAAAGGKAFVTVSTAGGTSPAAALAVSQPKPAVTSLSPMSVAAGGPNLVLTINGTNFLPGAGASVARWNYVLLATTYVNSSQLMAVLPASMTNGPGTVGISVVTAGGISNFFTFTVNPAQPVIANLSPNWASAGSGDFVLYVSGTHFLSSTTINWGTTPLSTYAVAGWLIAAKVPAGWVASVGTVNVTVTTAGGTSTPAVFSITQPRPAITSLSPSSVAAGGGSFTLTINGANFSPKAAAEFGTTMLDVHHVSSTQLTAVVPSSAIASAGPIGVIVYVPGIGLSSSAHFTINPAPPVIASLSPATVSAGGAGFMLTIKGAAFTPASTSKWGTTSLGTVYVGPTQLIAAVPASLIVESGTGSITVSTSAGTSAPAIMPIKPAVPQISGLNPGQATAGGAAFTMTIDGQYFTTASTAKWGSTALTTGYVSETQLTAAVPARLIAGAGSASITVTTAAGTSAPAVFTVYPAPRITTTSLPPATADNAYSGPIKVTGGVPGYTWTVTGLPGSFSFFNTSGSTLTIAGTPAEAGVMNFQVSVADASGVTAGPVSYAINVASGPNGANNGSLNGSYVCLLQGFFDDDGTRWASLASFQADGMGHFSTGAFDTNSNGVGSASGTIDGSYAIGSDLNGMASLHTILTDGAAGIQTTKWAVALTGAAQPAQEFRMVEADDLGERPSGEQGTADCILATASAFSASTISGSSFVFALEGEDRGGNLKAEAGLFSASAGKIVSGSIDQAQGGSATVQTTALSGSYTAPDPATGRFKIALKAGGTQAGLTVYIIDANRMFVLDNTSNIGEEAGSMRTQQQTSYSAANLSGPFVLYMRGAEFNLSGSAPSGYFADVFVGAGDGGGNIAIDQSYTNDNGVYSAGRSVGGPIALDFDSARPGRATFQSAIGTAYLYLYDFDSAIEMSVGDSGSMGSGWLEARTLAHPLTASTVAALNGNYLLGELPLLNGGSNGSVGEIDLTGGSAINGALTTAGGGLLSWDQAASMSFGWDAAAPGTSTFLVADGALGTSSCASINATRFVCTSQTDPSPNVVIAQQ
jgi:hypothetical protein